MYKRQMGGDEDPLRCETMHNAGTLSYSACDSLPGTISCRNYFLPLPLTPFCDDKGQNTFPRRSEINAVDSLKSNDPEKVEGYLRKNEK